MALVAAMAAPQGGRWPSRRWQLWQCGRCDGGVVMAAEVVMAMEAVARAETEAARAVGGGDGGEGGGGGD